MLRRLYLGLIRFHPAAFRQRFGEEMLDCYELATSLRDRTHMLADALLSLVRQWLLRPEFRRPVAAADGSGSPVEMPIFQSVEVSKPRTRALVQGGIASLILLVALVESIGGVGPIRRMLIGSHHPSPHLLAVRDVAAPEHSLHSTVKFGPEIEDPWLPIASVYFRAIRVLYSLDADHDLTLTPWEIITGPAALRRLDRNHDGKLSPEECGLFQGISVGIAPAIRSRAKSEFMRVHPVLAALDTDHDGELSPTEIENSPQALRTLDRNHDGSLTPDELMPDEAALQTSVVMVHLDLNQDGVLSPEERRSEEAQELRKVFENADTNRDGNITREELQREILLRSAQRRVSAQANRTARLP